MTNLSALRLRDDVAVAAEVVPPAWPLSSVIAVNPLAGFEDRPFEQALADAGRLFGTRGLLSLAEYRSALHTGRITDAGLRDALVRRIGWASDHELHLLLVDLVHGLDEPAPVRTARTVAEVHDERHGTRLHAQIDAELSAWWLQWTTGPGAAPDAPAVWPAWASTRSPAQGTDPVEALADALGALRVPHYAQRAYLERHLAALPGWIGHLRWREEHRGQADLVLSHLAMATSLEAELVAGQTWYEDDGPRPRPPAASTTARATAVAAHLGLDPSDTAKVDDIADALRLLPGAARLQVWQDAYERAVHDRLLLGIDARPAAPTAPGAAAGAQVVCCIDVRSEGLRRHLEQRGHETFGYAGFFGLAARFVPVTGHGATDQCPVLVSPAIDLREQGRHGTRQATTALLDRAQHDAAIDDAWHAATHHPIAPLAVAEATGWLAGPVAAMRTFAPATSAWLGDRLRPAAPASEVDRGHLAIHQQADVVAGVLRLGIGARPARLVVLCGHDARSDNNPMESALACGACGGNGGGPNARAVAAMANDPEVRAELAQRGMPLPDHTVFVAAVHETGADRATVLDPDLVPASHRGDLAGLQQDLAAAGRAAAHERAATLPGRRRRHRRQRARARDWAEPLPEAGLAGNMAFVVGPRSLTAHLDLDRRVFLHSYERADDPDGSVLTGILTAPLIVGQWINAQYSMSTTDPERLGAGSKVVHNPVADVGVLSGSGGDLRRGLSLQSVRCGDRLLHEPVRLMAVVDGSLAHVDAAIAASPTLRRLVEHEWIHLVARDPDGDRAGTWQQRTAVGWFPREEVR